MARLQEQWSGQAEAPLPKAPAAECLPQYPASWYRFCASRDVCPGPYSKDFLGRRLVAYRTASGSPVILEGRCAHLGADLGRGSLENDELVCPFHGWAYDATGECTRVPGEICIPAFARQARYPVVERHGSLFVFNGPEPLFPLPFFIDENPDAYVAGRPFEIVADCSWYMLTANGFDVAHFRTVHDRTLEGPPRVDCPATYARRLRYTASVTGDSIFDKILRRTVGRQVDVSITSWGGPLVLVSGDFKNAKSRILISARPLADHRTMAEVIVLGPRRGAGPLNWLGEFLSLEIRRLFTQGFMKHDVDRLPGIAYRPDSLLESEREMIDFFGWLAGLPRSPYQPDDARGQ